jgi:hypothetical protein
VGSGTTFAAAALFLTGSVAAYGPEPISAKVATDVPNWSTITLGTHAGGHALHEALRAADYGIGGVASDVLDLPEFRVSQSRRKVSLAVLSAADLGFEAEGASLEEIYRRAARLGLGLCPAEVAPELRLQYVDQPIGEFLHVAMKPVVMANGDAVGLSVGNGGAGLLLVGRNIRPDLIVPPNYRFVFVRRSAGPADTDSIHRIRAAQWRGIQPE